jgi:PIN domain-containing protein
MRSQFKGHFKESQETIDELWKTATFVFDANVLLNLYRYSDKARKEFLKLLTSIQGRCWLPEQCAHEFLSNRLNVIRTQVKAYEATAKSIGEIRDKFAGSNGHPFISEKNFSDLSSTIAKIDKELTRNRKTQSSRILQDEIRDEIADIFEGRVGEKFSDEDLEQLFKDGETRYSEQTPPGYKDASKHKNPTLQEKRSNFGDLVFWKQTLNLARSEQKSIILVTDEQKEDWWLKASGDTVGPRPELIREFCEFSEQRLLIYTPNSFLVFSEKQLGIKVSEKTIDEIRAEHKARLTADSSVYFERDQSTGEVTRKFRRRRRRTTSTYENETVIPLDVFGGNESPTERIGTTGIDDHIKAQIANDVVRMEKEISDLKDEWSKRQSEGLQGDFEDLSHEINNLLVRKRMMMNWLSRA